MRVRISHLVNSLTRQALYERVAGYVEKEQDFADLEERLRRDYGIEHLHRFDLGENADGCSPMVAAYLAGVDATEWRRSLSGYPESAARLKAGLARLHGVPTDWIALGTGVVSFISILCHAFYEWGDRALLPTPTFFVIEEYILRSGAMPVYLPMRYEDGYAWTKEMTHQVVRHLHRGSAKMLWLCSPNNPTGKAMPADAVDEILRAAEDALTMVVVDEAYGEFSDDLDGHSSAVRLLGRYENLIVLRSFSKAYGLAGMRVGYAMMSSRVVHDAVARQMEYFPVTGLSLVLARVAAEDQSYLHHTRQVTRTRVAGLAAEIGALGAYEFLPGECNIGLLRRPGHGTHDLIEALARCGVLVASADVEGLQGGGWVRITCRDESDNANLIAALRTVKGQVLPAGTEGTFPEPGGRD